MSRTALQRRLQQMRARLPEECTACRIPPPIVILHDDEPGPPDACPACGRVYTGITCVRLVRVERGPL